MSLSAARATPSRDVSLNRPRTTCLAWIVRVRAPKVLSLNSGLAVDSGAGLVNSVKNTCHIPQQTSHFSNLGAVLESRLHELMMVFWGFSDDFKASCKA